MLPESATPPVATGRDTSRTLVPALIYAALCTAVVSSLGMLLVPSIADSFDISVSTAQWMLTVNLLVGAVATPVMGRISDGPHKKTLLLVSLVIVLAGSVIAAVAPTFPIFLLGRGMQGLTYGIVAVAIAVARRYLAADRVGPAISTLSVTVGTGIGLGYPLTGVIAGVWEYQHAFWCAALFIVSAIWVVWKYVPDGPDAQAPHQRFDALGTALLGSGLTCLLLGISEGATWGWTSAATLGVLVAAMALLTLWVGVELRSDHPLINLRTLRSGHVLLANVAAIALGGALYIGLSVASLVAQGPTSTEYGLGLPVLWAGFVMLPLSVGSLTANRVVRRLSGRIPLAHLLPVGAAAMALAGVLLWVAHAHLWQILVGMLVFGLGMGASYAAMPALIARSVAVEELGSSVSFNQVLRTIGSSFGTAASAAILATHADSSGQANDRAIDLTFELAALVCLALSVLLLTHAFLRRGAPRG